MITHDNMLFINQLVSVIFYELDLDTHIYSA